MKLGDIVQVHFWDHSSNMAPVKCTVWGKVALMTRLHVELSSWEIESNDLDTKEANREYVSILKSAIISTKVLK